MWKLLKFIISDFISDIKFIINVINGKIRFDSEEIKIKIKKITNFQTKDFTQNWIWIIVCIFAFVSGVLVSANYYQNECNTFIYDNYIVGYKMFTAEQYFDLKNIAENDTFRKQYDIFSSVSKD